MKKKRQTISKNLYGILEMKRNAVLALYIYFRLNCEISSVLLFCKIKNNRWVSVSVSYMVDLVIDNSGELIKKSNGSY